MYRASPASPASSSAASTRRSTSGSTLSATSAAADRLRGKVAIANAKIAYARYKACSPARAGRRWPMRAPDAAPALGFDQRQEPGLQRHHLCRGLIGRRHRQHHAARDDGRVPRPWRGQAPTAIEQDIEGARALARESGGAWRISLKEVTATLLRDGVRQFAAAFDKLFGIIALGARKRSAAIAASESQGRPGVASALLQRIF